MIPVNPGQLRRWVDGSGSPFLILDVDRSKKDWNVKFLTNGKVESYHERVFKSSSVLINEAG